MQLIYVDDEKAALDNFRLKTEEFFQGDDKLDFFRTGEEAIEFAKKHTVDVAFLDIELPEIHGLELARKLKQMCRNVKIIFVTAYSGYALEAFGVDAVGYILKPYSKYDVLKELNKAKMIRSLPAKRIKIKTIPDFVIEVDGKLVRLGKSKQEELLALLVDRGEKGITSREAISCLWPERLADSNTQALYRVTLKRLMDLLEEEGIGYIIASKGRERYILTDEVDCDLYKILSGDKEAATAYSGEYLRNYSWAEARNAQLSSMLLFKNKDL